MVMMIMVCQNKLNCLYIKDKLLGVCISNFEGGEPDYAADVYTIDIVYSQPFRREFSHVVSLVGVHSQI